MHAKTKKWIKRGLIGSTLAIVLGAGLTFYLLQRPPAVWSDSQALLEEISPAERTALAEGVMQRLTTAADRLLADQDALFGVSSNPDFSQQLTDAPVDETFELELSNKELLSVASEWAEKWVEQRGYEPPDQMNGLVVMIKDGELNLAFELVVGSWRQIFSGKATLRFDSDGMAHGSVSNFTAGSLPLPIASVGDWVAKQLPAGQTERAAQIGDWVAELEDFEFRPVLELEHRRRARVIAMQVREDSLVMTMRLQDHRTYKAHNVLLKTGAVAVNDVLPTTTFDGSAIADVPTTTD
ncbi:MAG: hypothetical protein AB8C95_13455 [Phycisphaeraceae bacterium]